jgi:alanyl-tRNA synthetase
VALLASQNADGLQVLVARGEGSTFDCGAWLKQAAARAGGRAGGSPGRAEGRLPLGADWHRLVEET